MWHITMGKKGKQMEGIKWESGVNQWEVESSNNDGVETALAVLIGFHDAP